MIHIPLFPLNMVLFPETPLHLHIFEDRYRKMVYQCIENNQRFGVVLIRHGEEAYGPPAIPYEVGCTARIVQIEPVENNRLNLMAMGEERFRILAVGTENDFLSGDVELIPKHADVLHASDEVRTEMEEQVIRYLRVFSRTHKVKMEIQALRFPEDILKSAYLCASLLQVPLQEKQALLEEDDSLSLVDELVRMFRRENAYLEWIGKKRVENLERTFRLN
jgi:uncharacterized protein